MQKKVPKRSIWLLPAILASRLARVGRYFSESGQLLQIATCRFSYPATARQTMWSLTLPQVAATLAARLAANKTSVQRGSVSSTIGITIKSLRFPFAFLRNDK